MMKILQEYHDLFRGGNKPERTKKRVWVDMGVTGPQHFKVAALSVE